MTAYVDDVSDGITGLPDELILHIFKFLPAASLIDCEQVCERWKKLAKDGSVWRQLVIVYSGKPGQTKENARNLEIITSHSKYIKNLKIQYIYSYPVIKSILVRYDHLISLELVMCRLGKDFEEDIVRWPHLRKLNLKNSLLLQIDEDLTIQYDHFPNLKYLSLSDFGLADCNRDSLIRCANLAHILIDKIRDISMEYIRKVIISKKSILQTFHFYGGDDVNDECLTLLTQCSYLKDLAITRCENLTDEGLLLLPRLTRIKHLQIWNNATFSEEALLMTLQSASMLTLRSLSISRIKNVSPNIVDFISENYKNLKFFAVYQCPRIINTDYEKELKAKFRNIDVVLY